MRNQKGRHLGQVLLAALRLEVIPLIAGFGFLDGGFVFVKHGIGLRRAAFIGEQRTYCGQNRSGQCDAADKRVVAPTFRRFVKRSIVCPAYFKLFFGHCFLLSFATAKLKNAA